MFKIWNEYYYLDLDALEEYVQIKPEVKEIEEIEEGVELKDPETQVHLVKYDTCKLLMEVIFFKENEEVDEKLGPQSDQLSIPFKLAFNTLLNKKIINKF
jgi:hypothetical protein